ncbi:hypothetical protein N0V93_001484 [Gnomoniopsis smithogilvyi]|uniref:SUR7 protein n=1 Tax=Gnomoniopsis smithogilvyi TaxID=1191159 RepID=A0A9W8Z3T3_9PEZI|nr:hypothetical protein N0V93_001484 [Gnomoniopsis smithogilvyi]
MGNIGRLICVGLPFALTIASLISLLVAALAGVTDKSLYNFRIDTANLSVSASDIESLLSKRSVPLPDITVRDFGSDVSGAADSIESTASTVTSNLGDDASSAASSAAAAASTAASSSDLASAVSDALSTNISAADLGLADAYYINLWNYCSVNSNGTTICPKGKFDWATNATKEFESTYEAVVSAAGGNSTIPDSLKDGMDTFATVTKWTEICFIIAFVSLGLTLVFGVFATCSRAISCCAWIIAGFSVIAVGAAAGLATGMAAVVVGLAEGSAKAYGVTGAFNTRFLATIWLSFAFILVATIFWLASVCCCSPDRRSARSIGGRRRGGKDYESSAMTPAGAYAPLQENHASAYTGAGGAHVQGDNYYHSGDGAKYENYRSH